MVENIWFWIGFNVFILALLAIDLGVFHRRAHEVTIKEAAVWTVVWISLAMLFNAGLFYFEGHQPGMMFLAGYLIEKSLSVDNIFVFVMLFGYFNVPLIYQHRVLFWGILGALLMRGTLIGLGAYLIGQFHWILYLFGAFLIFTGIRMAVQKEGEGEVHVEDNPLVKLLRRMLPITSRYRQDQFFVRKMGYFMATPLLVVLLVVETTDLLFAFDSIPAILAITQDPFIVFTSNALALLGMRALYFAVQGLLTKLRYLHQGLAAILVFVGSKLMLTDYWHLSSGVSLVTILSILATAVAASLLLPERAASVEVD